MRLIKSCLAILIAAITAVSCQQANKPTNIAISVATPTYELEVPENAKAIMVLFSGYPHSMKQTATEFPVEEQALSSGFGLMRLAFNQHLWLSMLEQKQLKGMIDSTLTQYNLANHPLFIGGFSSGGNMALLLANYMKEQDPAVPIQGVFVVDAPVDLNILWNSAKHKLAKDSTNIEGQMIHQQFTKSFGVGDSSRLKLQTFSPFSRGAEASLDNLGNLKNVSLRFYTEPDTSWWQQNRGLGYKAMNSYPIGLLYQEAKRTGEYDVRLITSTNKGYRANGDRHPHSWSIVDQDALIAWMNKECVKK